MTQPTTATGGSTTRTLTIDGMKGDDCVNKVRGALKNVPNVSTQSVKVGSATIEADQSACTAACSAIKSAGYQAKDSQGQQHQGSTHGRPDDMNKSSGGDHARQESQHGTGGKSGDPMAGRQQEGNRPSAAQRG